MVRKCCVCGSTNSAYLHLYSLPSNEGLKSKWLKWLKGVCGKLPKNILVCGNHFTGHNPGRKIGNSAVPSVLKRTPINESSVVACHQPIGGEDSDVQTDEYSSKVEITIPLMNTKIDTTLKNDTATGSSPIEYSCYIEVDIDDETHIDPDHVPVVATTESSFVEYSCSIEVDFNGETYIDPDHASVLDFNDSLVEQAHGNATDVDDRQLNNDPETMRTKEDKVRSKKVACNKKKRSCAVQGCLNENNSKLFTFPQVVINSVICLENLERCKQWIKFSGNSNLFSVKTTSLHKQYYICGTHFSTEQYYNADRNVLLPNQVPTLLSFKPFNEDQLGNNFPNFGYQCDSFADIESLETPASNSRFNRVSQTNIKDRHFKDFIKDMDSLKQYSCPNCKEIFWSKRKLKNNCLHKNNCFKYSALNSMDPGKVPDELTNLTMIEEALISPVHAMLSVYKIKGHQFGYSGNVINFPQSVSDFTGQLPHKISDLPSIITVRTDSNNDKPKDFHVRSQNVFRALSWLIKNNPLYEDITISEENMLLLPEDGNVYDLVPSVITQEKQNEADSQDFIDSEIEQTDDDIELSFVPSQPSNNQNDLIKEVFAWPSIDTEAINEFKTRKLVAKAFPCLFPYGVADLKDERDHKVSDSQYFQHMLRYHDGRFSRHPKFRFYAMNCLMRWNALTKGSLYVKKNEELKNMNIEQLKNYIKENPRALNKIMYQCSNMRGTKPYWKARHSELLSMIEQVGMPTLFFTLSAADLHWPGLFKILATDEDPETMSEARRRQLIAENPILIDKYFDERVNSFINKVVNPKFKVKDHWYRVEYQHRGSPHIHGLLWLTNAPDVTDLHKKTPEELQQIIDYFDELVFTEHPDINAHPPLLHPCRKNLEDVIDLKHDLAELLNTVQRHTRCTPGYCLKTNKNNGGLHKCRFKFPKDLKDKSELILSENGEYELETKRNDPRLNKYNPDMILIWRANMDITPVLSKRALVNYLAKYVSKAETKSKTIEELFQEICDKNDKGAKNVIQRLYLKTCSERDYSAQEVGHIVMSESMVRCSRSFVPIFLKSDEDWVKIQDKIENGQSLLQKYSKREDQYEDKSLWFMAKRFNFQTRKMKKTNSITVVFPKIIYKPEKTSNEDYYRMLVVLHVPWRDISQFKIEDVNASWKTIYSKYSEVIKKNNDVSVTIRVDDELVEEHLENDENTDQSSRNISTEDWMAISSMTPSQKTRPVDLGRRAIDSWYDWSATYNKYSKYGTIEELQSFISKQKKDYECPEIMSEYPDVEFNNDQRKVLAIVDEQIQFLSTSENSDGKVAIKAVIVQGSAGTGKSLIIKAMKSKIQSVFGTDSVLVLAPTGVAALNIEGATIHSKLHINTNKEFLPLENETARKFCNDFQNVKFVVIDEYSMVGLNMIGMIDQRLKQATGSDENFGGLFVYFFGDILQLPPVLDTAVYSNATPTNLMKLHGKFVWESISHSVVLNEVHRQSDDRFKQVLQNISNGTVTTDDYKLLKTRFTSNVSPEERKSFKDALKLYPLRSQVEKENMEYVEKLRNPDTNQPVPVARIPAKHNCALAEEKSFEDVGLSDTLFLGPSSKIMLRSNLWTKQGLVNGSIGVIVDIIYDKGKSSPDDAPAVLICTFDTYKGPYLGNDNILKLVPIPAITKSWNSECGQLCARTQFPIQLACAVTVHKAQGLTLLQALIDVGDRDRPPGLMFVALSRVKSLNGMLLQPFSLQRFLKVNQSETRVLKQMYLQNLGQKL